MYDDGYETIVNIDYSRVVIEKMRALHEQARPQMTCKSTPRVQNSMQH